MLQSWFDAGMPEGDPSLAPKPPTFPERWRLASPTSRSRWTGPSKYRPREKTSTAFSRYPSIYRRTNGFGVSKSSPVLDPSSITLYSPPPQRKPVASASPPPANLNSKSKQGQYLYEAPVELPKGTRIDVQIAYDNSTDNPANPRPSRIIERTVKYL